MKKSIKRILLVWPEFEISFWGMQYSLQQVNKKAVMAPLALITVAGTLPRGKYDFRHIDLNSQTITEADIEWADLVMLSGWGPQYRSILRLSLKCRKLKKKILIGGPLASEYHQILRNVDHIFVGEAEGFDLENLLDEIANDNAPHLIQGSKQPDIASNPVMPRYDLLDFSLYWQVTVQYARGCPFTCEFCDIIELYGRIQRTKTAEAMVSELESVLNLGFRGPVFFVDDNFYGNRKNIKNILPAIVDFQKRRDYPFYFYTEASINLAQNPDMLKLMKQAGFYCMFTGIETPNKASLKETRKVQNLKLDLVEAIEICQSYEFFMQAGFIIGFDSDPDNIADLIVDYVNTTGITVAMTGMLLALPATQLERRLNSEGRMMGTAGIDQFGLPNFITTAHPENLVEQFQKVLLGCFSKESLNRRLNKQQSIFSRAHPTKREIACTELEFNAEHLHLYSKKVLQDIDKLKSSTKFDEYIQAHESYWNSKSIDGLQPQAEQAVDVVPDGAFT